jgi:hypothetical protein
MAVNNRHHLVHNSNLVHHSNSQTHNNNHRFCLRFYDFSIGIWNYYTEGVVFFVFLFMIQSFTFICNKYYNKTTYVFDFQNLMMALKWQIVEYLAVAAKMMNRIVVECLAAAAKMMNRIVVECLAVAVINLFRAPLVLKLITFSHRTA